MRVYKFCSATKINKENKCKLIIIIIMRTIIITCYYYLFLVPEQFSSPTGQPTRKNLPKNIVESESRQGTAVTVRDWKIYNACLRQLNSLTNNIGGIICVYM